MKRNIVLTILLTIAATAGAQIKDFKWKLYGQFRTDVIYNSRDNVEAVDGMIYKYPKREVLDPDGKDLNDHFMGSAYALYTRLGLRLSGPEFFGARSSAKMEFDFRGNGKDYSLFRLRHAFFNLDWQHSHLLVGQTWNPFQGDVLPQMLNLGSGQPFQPFGRAPQIRYRYTAGKMQLTAATIWQFQYTTAGPDGKSNQYFKHSGIPELYAGIDYKSPSLLLGAGVEMLSIMPRMNTKGNDDKMYRTSERLNTLSYEAHMLYKKDLWRISSRTVYGRNMTHMSMIGGFGAKSIDKRTGREEYTPIKNISQWLNIVYGKTWRPSLFMGYSKNLGTDDALIDTEHLYGSGTDVDKLATAILSLTYNAPHWKIGCEYSYTSAWYGDVNTNNGKVENSSSVGNHRLIASASFLF